MLRRKTSFFPLGVSGMPSLVPVERLLRTVTDWFPPEEHAESFPQTGRTRVRCRSSRIAELSKSKKVLALFFSEQANSRAFSTLSRYRLCTTHY